MQESELAQVAELYDSPEGQVGPVLFGGHMHWGYWDDDTAAADFAAGAERLAQLMIAKTRIGRDQRFADLGCGFGLSGIKLAQLKHCHVDGVTISKVQQQKATAHAQAEGLQERVAFIHGSALAVPRPDQSYDGGWFFESIFHMGHRDALREAGRLLKPGATLTLTDLPTLPTTAPDFAEWIRERVNSAFVAKEDYPALLDEAGFELVEIDDISANVMPWITPKLKEAIDSHREEIERIMPGIGDERLDKWVSLFRRMSENLGYMIVTARKR